MKFHVGLMDRLFGKRVTLQVPGPDGQTRNVSVTEKWMQQMEREGRMTPAEGEVVLVHVSDPIRGLYDAHWVVGKDVERDVYEQFYDTAHQALYAFVVYEQGEPRVAVVRKGVFDQFLETTRGI